LQCTFHPFIGFPSYKAISQTPLAERVAIMSDPVFKARLLEEKSEKVAGDGTSVPPITDLLLAAIDYVAGKTFLLDDNPNYEQSAETSVYAMAQVEGQSSLGMLYDLMLQEEGQQLLYFPIYNYTDMNFDAVHTMMTHPRAMMGLSDGGAHVGTICDSSFSTYLLTYWVRDRTSGPKLALEEAVRKLTSEPADYMGMSDRGRLEVGLKANINVIDLENLRLYAPRMVRDLPAGGQRLLQDSSGYRSMLVAGHEVLCNDQLTGVYPGALFRGGH
jgi:N-acyl-D-aspartate/D-glutamate deacylase